MIRLATAADIPRLVEMGSRSLLNGPYKDKIKDNPQAAAELGFAIIEDQKGLVIVAEEDGKVIGLLALAIFPHYFTKELTAAEVMWYVEPEHRQSLTALCLFRRGEQEARRAGCTTMQFTAPTEQVAKAYEKLGYEAIEVAYRKNLVS